MSDQTEQEQPTAYEGWAVVELMGHRVVAGKCSEVQQFGVSQLRVDIPSLHGQEFVATQFYGGSSIYCLSPCDEAYARRTLQRSFELPPVVAVALKNDEIRHEPSLPGIPPPEVVDPGNPDFAGGQDD